MVDLNVMDMQISLPMLLLHRPPYEGTINIIPGKMQINRRNNGNNGSFVLSVLLSIPV